MASISKETRGGAVQWRVFFRNKHGQRQTIRLGKINKRAADSIRVKVEALNVAAIAGTDPDENTARWVATIGDELRQKLVNAGLIPCAAAPDEKPQESPPVALGEFLEAYITGRAIKKPNTRRNYEVTRQHLLSHFEADKPLQDVTPGDADDFKEGLIRKGLSGPTVAREVKRARQYFRAAVRKKIIDANPFQDVKGSKQTNKSREYFVERETIGKVIDECPDYEWRLIAALSRYGGLRCPSEHLALRWDAIDWERDRMTVTSPKTEHHEGGESRVVPIFPELRPFLAEAFEQAEPGSEYVITRYRAKNSNLRTQFERIIRRAGESPWPKLFQNMRASRETELSAEYPLHVVCAWIGNSPQVARDHYLQVTDEHYRQAAESKGGGRGSGDGCTRRVQVGAEDGCKRWDTRRSADSRSDTQNGRKPERDKDLRPVLATRRESWQTENAPPRGNEQTPDSQGNTQSARGWVQPLGDTSGDSSPIDVDLAEWLQACPVALDEETAAGVLAMVKAAGDAAGADR
jgi:integrase